MPELRIKLFLPPLFRFLREEDIAYAEAYNMYRIPSYGMGIMTALMRAHGYDVEQKDLALKQTDKPIYYNHYSSSIAQMIETARGEERLQQLVEEVFASMKIGDSNVVGFSIFSFGHFLFALMLARKLKETSDVSILFGGTFISLYGRLYSEAFEHVDYMVIGNGWEPVHQLLKLLEHGNGKPDQIPNLIYRNNGKVVNTPFVHFHLEDLPLPDFTDYDLNLYRNPHDGTLILPYQVTRGCVQKCSFCIQHPDEEAYEKRSYDRIIQDLEEMSAKYNCHNFMFSDHNIGCSYKFLNGLMDCFLQSNVNFKWHGHIGIHNMNYPLLEKMHAAGCDSLMFGIESGSNTILRWLDKQQTSDEAYKVLKYTHKAGIETMAYLMTGYPHETDKDVRETVKFIKKSRKYIDHLCIRSLVIFHNSSMYHDPSRYGIGNLRPSRLRYISNYDEVNGLAWKEKLLQQGKTKARVQKAHGKALKLVTRKSQAALLKRIAGSFKKRLLG